MRIQITRTSNPYSVHIIVLAWSLALVSQSEGPTAGTSGSTSVVEDNTQLVQALHT